MKLEKVCLILCVFLFSGCQSADPRSAAKARHPWWSLHFTAPSYMTGWVEASAVVDINNRFFPRGGEGGIGIGVFEDDGVESARGWPGFGGNGRTVTGADLPRRIFVRWQSSVEPQTYQGWIEISEEIRQMMRQSIIRRCTKYPGPSAYDMSLTFGLAPGGIVQIWVWDECLDRLPVARVKVDIEPLGPDKTIHRQIWHSLWQLVIPNKSPQ